MTQPTAPPIAPKQAAVPPTVRGGGATKWVLLGVGGAGAAGAAVALSGSGDPGTTPTSNSSTNTPTNTTTTPNTPSTLVKRGDYSGQGSISYTSTSAEGRVATCTANRTLTGAFTTALEQAADGSISGTATTTTSLTVLSTTGCSGDAAVVGSVARLDWTLTARGNARDLTFSGQQTFSTNPSTGGSVSGTRTLVFQGSVQNGVISGTLTLTETADGTSSGSSLTWRGTASAEVSLR